MPLTRQQKEQAVATVEQGISRAASVVFIAFDGLTVADVSELRDRLFEQGGVFKVVPKRLLRLVMRNARLGFDPMSVEGQVAVVWGKDAVMPAKTLYEFARDHESIRLLAGVLEGNELSLEEVTSLAQLPSRDELLGNLVGVLAGPMRGFVSVLSGVPRATVYVLKAIADQKQ